MKFSWDCSTNIFTRSKGLAAIAAKTEWGCRTKILFRSKGLAAIAAKTECTKITLGSQLPKIIFVHVVSIALLWKPFEQIYSL